jgi:hypothetical protein
MGALFDIALELTRRGVPTPAAWEFRCSPLGPGEPEGFFAESIAEASTDNLVEFGELMHRYARRLQAAGLDY